MRHTAKTTKTSLCWSASGLQAAALSPTRLSTWCKSMERREGSTDGQKAKAPPAVVQVISLRLACSYFAVKCSQSRPYKVRTPLVQVCVKLAGQVVCNGQKGGRQAAVAISYSDGLLLPSFLILQGHQPISSTQLSDRYPALSHKPCVRLAVCQSYIGSIQRSRPG